MYLSEVYFFFFLAICKNITQAENGHKECNYIKTVNSYQNLQSEIYW